MRCIGEFITICLYLLPRFVSYNVPHPMVGVKTYQNNTQGTINYSTGQITLTSLNVASISNIRGSTSTVIELTVTPDSNDIIPVRDQILQIDVANSSVTVEGDTFASGTSDGGTSYTTTSSY